MLTDGSVIKPPAGQCAYGQWQVPSQGRNATNWEYCSRRCRGNNARCPDADTGAAKCYPNCDCMCSTASSCRDITDGPKSGCVEQVGCSWDEATKTCSAANTGFSICQVRPRAVSICAGNGPARSAHNASDESSTQ